MKIPNGKGGFYLFSNKEVEQMKNEILESTNLEGHTCKFGIVLEGLAYCCACSKAEKEKRIRKIALYSALTNEKGNPIW